MFVLAEMKHVIRIPPHDFQKRLNDAISEELNKKLANKVVLNVGLCIALFDITRLEDSYIFPGDGAAHTKVNFRYVVFRPFMEEILIGRIKSCSPEGVQVTLGFFDDIIIPPASLQHPSRFDETEQAWVWKYDTDGDTHDLFMDPVVAMENLDASEIMRMLDEPFDDPGSEEDLDDSDFDPDFEDSEDAGETIRFRVTAESFVETSPVGPENPDVKDSVDTTEEPKVPYKLTGSINEPGLGLLSWWANS